MEAIGSARETQTNNPKIPPRSKFASRLMRTV
jgi:hypothetical protein